MKWLDLGGDVRVCSVGVIEAGCFGWARLVDLKGWFAYTGLTSDLGG